ncbi:MAG: beta-lactamase family protein, partial [Acidobacteriaceae bacterium]|nr:beta-lactamase family protein [Acidobacteriaceae bacterium]
MFRSAQLSFVVLFLLSYVQVHAQAQPETKPAPQMITADATNSTPSGATFVVPAGWTYLNDAGVSTLQPPETDTRILILDVNAANADAAVASAWAKALPGMKRPLKIATPIPDRDGWSSGKRFDYETSPNERAVVVALAKRAGDTWTVTLLDGLEPTFEKRSAQIGLIVRSLRPKAYQRESFAGRKALALTAERIEILKSFVDASMKKLGVPGAGFALIDNNRVVYEGGVGVRELGKSTPVDANTLFMAASNTKGMTTLLLARLVDAKKLAWDQQVSEVYKSFKLGDAETTREVEVKHLVCACTGLPRQDMEWLFNFKKYNPASTFTLLSNMQPTS